MIGSILEGLAECSVPFNELFRNEKLVWIDIDGIIVLVGEYCRYLSPCGDIERLIGDLKISRQQIDDSGVPFTDLVSRYIMASAFNSLLNAFYAFLGTAAVHEHNMDCVSLGFSSPDKIKFFLMRPYCFETECNALLKKDLCSLQYSMAAMYLCSMSSISGNFLTKLSGLMMIGQRSAIPEFSMIVDYPDPLGPTMTYRSGFSCPSILPFLPVLPTECSVFLLCQRIKSRSVPEFRIRTNLLQILLEFCALKE